MSYLKVVNPYVTSEARGLPGRAGLGYLAPVGCTLQPRESFAVNAQFERGAPGMPVFGPSLYSNYGGLCGTRNSRSGRFGLGLFGTGQTMQVPAGSADAGGTTYGSQPIRGAAEGFLADLPSWVGNVAGGVHDFLEQIPGVGDNPASGATVEDSEMKDIGTPAAPGGLFGMDNKTLLLLGAAAIGVYFLAKKG